MDFQVNRAKTMTDLVTWDLSPAAQDSEEEEFAESLTGLPMLDDSVILSDADGTLTESSMTFE